MSLLLIRLKPTEQQEMQLTFAVKGVFVGEKNIAVWDHEQVTIYELIDSTHSPLKTQVLSSFACVVSAVAIFQQNLYCLEPEKVNVRTMQVGSNHWNIYCLFV
uniref:CPSF_A domain-containing protein n=1 Tax=Ascaris lumbricoides TaxID=6252 RepID=A0A0M3IML6_ASCLU